MTSSDSASPVPAQLQKNNNEKYIIPFSEIKLIHIFKKSEGSTLNYKYKEVDQYHSMKDYIEVPGYKLWLKNLSKVFYSIGSERIEDKERGIIHISRKSGRNWLSVILPWFHSLERSNNLFLSVSNPEEFFDQLSVAYEKWKRMSAKEYKQF